MIGAGHLALQREMDRGDRVAFALLVERHARRGIEYIGLEIGFTEDQRQRHGEAGGMGRADQLLGVAAGLAFEAAGEAVGIGAERAALGRDRALAVLDAAFPMGRACFVDRHGVVSCSGLNGEGAAGKLFFDNDSGRAGFIGT